MIPLLDEYKEREKRLARGHEGVKGLQRRVLGVGAQGSEGSTEKGIRSGGTRE